ncbi:Uncharacterized protein Rs2_35475 [Raphanus sativus]|nr:Uncharacterized protein Rs2_35475 [Raphanus sativus]
MKEMKPKDADPWSINNQLGIIRLDRERTKLEKCSDQEEYNEKSENIEQSDHEVSQIQGFKLPTTLVKVQHVLSVQYVDTARGSGFKEEIQQEKKEATMENRLQNKTRSICDELSKRYFLQPDPCIPCF